MKTQWWQTVPKLVAVAMLAFAGPALAVPLSSLLDGGSITSGDKLFDNWSLVAEPVDPEFGDPIDLSLIDVIGIGDGSAGNEYGLSFDLGFDLGSDQQGRFDFMDLFFSYMVTALGGNVITGVTMSADGDAEGDDAFFTVVKSVLNTQGQDVIGGVMEVFDDTLQGTQSTDSAAVPGLASLLVRDNIALFYSAVDGESAVTLNSFEQRFIQRAQDAPAPATLALVLLGLLGMAGRRIRM